MYDNIKIVIKEDYDGYFGGLVNQLISKKTQFNHHTVMITAGPYRPYACSYVSKEGTLALDFYSALASGFGSLSESERQEITELL